MGVLGGLGGPSPGQKPRNKSCGMQEAALGMQEACPGQEGLFSPGGGGEGKGTLHFKVFTLCEPFTAPQVPPAWLW